MKYTVRIDRHAERQVRRLPPSVRERVLRAAYALADDPCPPGVRKMRGADLRYRIRVGIDATATRGGWPPPKETATPAFPGA